MTISGLHKSSFLDIRMGCQKWAGTPLTNTHYLLLIMPGKAFMTDISSFMLLFLLLAAASQSVLFQVLTMARSKVYHHLTCHHSQDVSPGVCFALALHGCGDPLPVMLRTSRCQFDGKWTIPGCLFLGLFWLDCLRMWVCCFLLAGPSLLLSVWSSLVFPFLENTFEVIFPCLSFYSHLSPSSIL